jgi:hypothetical protein
MYKKHKLASTCNKSRSNRVWRVHLNCILILKKLNSAVVERQKTMNDFTVLLFAVQFSSVLYAIKEKGGKPKPDRKPFFFCSSTYIGMYYAGFLS